MMLHVTIGSMGTNGVNLEKDLRSVKTAILYADKAKLCSHVAALAWSMNNFNVLPLQLLAVACDLIAAMPEPAAAV
jgi:hypothetical protein